MPDENAVPAPAEQSPAEPVKPAPTVVTSGNKKEVLASFKGCKVEGCKKPHHARGLCSMHYKQAGPPKPKAKLKAAKPAKAKAPASAPKQKRQKRDPAEAGKPHCLSVYFPDLALRERVIKDAKSRGLTPGRVVCEAVAKYFGVKP